MFSWDSSTIYRGDFITNINQATSVCCSSLHHSRDLYSATDVIQTNGSSLQTYIVMLREIKRGSKVNFIYNIDRQDPEEAHLIRDLNQQNRMSLHRASDLPTWSQMSRMFICYFIFFRLIRNKKTFKNFSSLNATELTKGSRSPLIILTIFIASSSSSTSWGTSGRVSSV